MTTMRTVRGRRPNGSPETPVRSMRVSDAVWEAARARAEKEGTTMSQACALFLEGYALYKIDLPEIKLVYRSQ